MNAPDPCQPSPALLAKLGSIIIHAAELVSPQGHHVDADALMALLEEAEVAEWLKAMDAMAMLPKMRGKL